MTRGYKPESSAIAGSVLLVEDEILLRLYVAEALRHEGFQVFEAVDPDEAITVLKTLPVDVVVTDLHLRAAGDGMIVARYVREHFGSLPLLLASAQAPPLDNSPFDAFFIKPYGPEDISSWIKRRRRATDRIEEAL